jgi:hypothetical protein
LRVLVDENSKLISRLSKSSPGEFLMCAFERNQGC